MSYKQEIRREIKTDTLDNILIRRFFTWSEEERAEIKPLIEVVSSRITLIHQRKNKRKQLGDEPGLQK